MGNVTFKNFSINKLNKTLKQLNRNGVLVGPRATKGSYGDLANQLQASVDKADEKERKRKGRKAQQAEQFGDERSNRSNRSGRRGKGKGMGIAVKGGGRILWKILKTNSQV